MDETLLARLSLKWNLPLDCLASDLPHIHELVESRDWAAGDSNHDTRDGQPADDAREIFFFQFPFHIESSHDISLSYKYGAVHAH